MTRQILNKLQGDKVIWLVVFLIAMISLLAVYTGTGAPPLRAKASTEYYLLKHGILLGMGFVVMYMVHKLDYRIFAKLSDILLYLTIPILAYTILLGDDINDARRWISVFGQSFQPSDLGKVALLIYLAKVLTQKQDVIKDFYKGFLPVVSWIVLICMLIAPSDLSTASLLFVTSMMLIFIAGVDMKYLAYLFAAGAISFTLLYTFADRSTTWDHRINSWWSSLTDTQYKPEYQMRQAYAAIYSGGPIGKGVGKGTHSNYLPNPTSDMIYPVIIEEYGLLGGVLVLGLYLLLLFRAVGIATMSKTFGALLAAGLAFMLVLQAIINMGVSVGLLPVTGLPMPMLSMGGTSILFTSLALGIILSVSRHALENRKPELVPA